jgi:hypothetical protein
LKNDAPLPRQTYAALANRFGEVASGFGSIDAFAGRGSMRGCRRHEISFSTQGL